MRDMIDFFTEVMLPLLVMGALVVGGIFALIASVSYFDCKGFREGTGIETRWSWGCYVKHEGQWVPKEYYFGTVLEHRIKDKR